MTSVDGATLTEGQAVYHAAVDAKGQIRKGLKAQRDQIDRVIAKLEKEANP